MNLFTGSKDKLLDFHNLVNGVTGHLWFIGSMIFGYILFIYIEKKINIKYWLFISVLIYLLILAGDSYSKLLHINIEHDFVRYFVSVPFIIIGYLCSHYGIFDKKIRKYTYLYIALAVFGFVLQGLEVTYLYKLSGYGPHNQEFLLGSAVFAFGMFGLCFNITIKNNIVSKLGEKYSLLVYLYHPLINIFIFEYYKPKELGGGFLFMLNPFISFSICLFVLVSINKISPRIISSLNGV